MMQVYVVTNDVNAKAYVGACAQPLVKRWKTHLSWAKAGRGYALHDAIRKHGADKFHIVRLWSGIVSRSTLKRLEEFYIASFGTMEPSGYNQTSGGTTRIFKPCSTEKRRKISEALMGHRVSEETRNRIRNSPCTTSFLGKRHSDSAKARISAARKGKSVSIEVRKKISESLLGNIPWNKGLKN